MVAVEIRTAVYDEENARIEWRALALVRADGKQLTIYGEKADDLIDGDVRVVSVQSGKPITAADGPEEWARSLPYAYRSGDIVAAVVHDDAPVRREAPSDHGHLPTIPPVPDLVPVA
jgi:hypothetical protein